MKPLDCRCRNGCGNGWRKWRPGRSEKPLFTPEELAELAAFDAQVDAEPLTLADFRETRERDKQAEAEALQPERLKRRQYNRTYYIKHRGEGLARAREYRAAHPERIAAAQKRYAETHKEAIAARMRAYRRQYYWANREKMLAQRKKYREAHREAVAAQQKAYRETHKEAIAETKRRWVEKNADAVKAYQKQYRAEHADRIAAGWQDYYRRNKEALQEKRRLYYEAHGTSRAAYAAAYRQKHRENDTNAQQGQRLRQARQRMGLSQKQLGQIVGYTQSSISLVETASTPLPQTIEVWLRDAERKLGLGLES